MRIDKVFTEQINLNIRSSSGIFDRFSIGDIFHARVVDFTANELILKLTDGTLFSAATVLPKDVYPGELLTFLVKNKDGGKLILEQQVAVSISNSEEQAIQAASRINTGPDPSLETSENINNSAAQAIQVAAGSNKSADTAIRVSESVNDNADPAIGVSASINNNADPTIQTASRINNNAEQTIQVKIQGQGQPLEINPALRQLMDGKFTLGKELEELFRLIEQAYGGTQSDKDTLNEENTLLKENPLIEGSELILESVPIKKDAPNKRNIHTKENALIEENIPGKENGLIKEIRKIIESMFVKADKTLIEKGINVEEIQKDILQKIDVLSKIISNSKSPFKSEIDKKIYSIKQSIRFMSEMKNYIYFQLPLITHNNRSTGEIYIMQRRNKKKKLDPENTTMLISLETANLGRIDSLINISGKRVYVSMSVERQDIIDYLKQHADKLYESLFDKGWRLSDVKYKLTRKEIPYIISAKKASGKPDELGRGISIDYRL